MSVIAFSRSIGPIPVPCFLSEKHESGLEITENPVEFGAKITDHAYILPKRVTVEVMHENAAATYAALVRFQESRVPFVLVTGLTVYQNMLIKSLNAQRDASNSKILRCTCDLQEIIIVETAYTDDGSSGTGKHGKPGGEKSARAATPSKGRAGDAATADRASGSAQRGDAAAVSATPREQSILHSMWN